MKIELVRPDDLLNLQIEAVNLRLDSGNPQEPVLVVEVPQRPAYLIVTFPPQTIAESAYFEFSIVKPAGDPNRPDADKNASASEPLDPPGQVKSPRKTSAQLGHPSRLVFIVPAEMRVPFSTEGLLDWSALELSVNPIAAIGANPNQQQIDAAPAIQPPTRTETAIEMPYRLVISPNAQVKWNHRDRAFTSQGRTELWHTRLQLQASKRTRAIELSPDHRAPLRAIWSPDYSPTQRPNPFAKDPDLQRTAMSGDDRYQIVVLTSAFHGYEVDIELFYLPILTLPVVSPVLAAAQPAAAHAIAGEDKIAAVASASRTSRANLQANPTAFYPVQGHG